MAKTTVVDSILGGHLQTNVLVSTPAEYIQRQNYNLNAVVLKVQRNGEILRDADWETPLEDGDRISIGTGKTDSGK